VTTAGASVATGAAVGGTQAARTMLVMAISENKTNIGRFIFELLFFLIGLFPMVFLMLKEQDPFSVGITSFGH
jgi:hypothetical protein